MGFFSWLFGIPSAGERKMCRNKVRFSSYTEAQQALKRINPGNSKRNKPNRYYKCPHCSGYHLTKAPQR